MASTNPFTLANAKKAYYAGVAGAITAAGSVSIFGLFNNGAPDVNAILGAVGVVVAGFVVAFFGAWLPTNSNGPVAANTAEHLPESDTTPAVAPTVTADASTDKGLTDA